MNNNGRPGNPDSESGAHGPTRRQVLVGGAATAAALAASVPSSRANDATGKRPLAIASANGREAVIETVKRIQAGAAPVEAAVHGVGLVENDPDDVTVGYGGLPNAEGVVQLDACCMDGPTMRAGGVAAVERIRHPARLALEVARRTSRVLLVADGAQRFARALGMPEEDLLTERARKIWLYWKAHMSGRDDWLPAAGESDDPDVQWFISRYGPVRPTGTINLCAVDAAGDLGGTTTTSGLAFKIPGRVGDSPLIGAGLFVDNEVGAAGSTGRGESVIQVAGSHTVVELMRRGQTPTAACLGALERVVRATRVSYLRDDSGRPTFDVKFYAVNKDGEVGAAAIWSGGRYVWCGSNLQPVIADCAYLYEKDDTER